MGRASPVLSLGNIGDLHGPSNRCKAPYRAFRPLVLRLIVSQVLELMLSDSGPKSARKSARANVLSLVLFLLDWTQLTAILVSPEMGWTFS